MFALCICVSSCRHAAIAKYFGDPPPTCNSSCDFCHNPAAVKRLSADAKLGTAPSSKPTRHRVSRPVYVLVAYHPFFSTANLYISTELVSPAGENTVVCKRINSTLYPKNVQGLTCCSSAKTFIIPT